MQSTIILILTWINLSEPLELDYFTCAVLYQNEAYLGKPFKVPNTNNKAFPLNSNIINKVESLVVKVGCVLTVHTDWRCGYNGWVQIFQAKDRNLFIGIPFDGQLFHKISCVRCYC